MHTKIVMKRNEGAVADFTDWELESDVIENALKPFIDKMISTMIKDAIEDSACSLYTKKGGKGLKRLINNILNQALFVVFSENGAKARVSIDVRKSKVEDLMLDCDIEIDKYEAYASAKVPLKKIIADAADEADCKREPGGRQKIADALRAIADSIEKV